MINPLPPPGSPTYTPTDVVVWVAILIIAVLVLGIIVLMVRRRILAKEAAEDGWLSQLRQMHKRGEISTEEYDAARKSLTLKLAARITDSASQHPSRTAAPQTRPRPAAAAAAGELRARPGFDLTGAPLPPVAPQPPESGKKPPPPPSAPGPYDRKPKR